MNISEKYWLTILITFCRYLSILMMGSGVAFILLGAFVNPWFFVGLTSWPLFIMWGIVNIRYLHLVTKARNLEFSKILENY